MLAREQVQLEAEEPAGGAPAAAGQLPEDPVQMDAAVVADGQLLGVDVVVACSFTEACPVVGQEEGVQQRLPGERQEVGVGDGPGEVALQLPEYQALIVVGKALEARQVVENEDGQALSLRNSRLSAGRVARLQARWQRMGGKIGFHLYAEIVNFGRTLPQLCKYQ